MKTIYEFTEAEKAELEDIDRQMMELYKRKAEIYALARVKYVTETREEAEGVEREIMRRAALLNSALIPKDGIVKFVKEAESDGKNDIV